MKDRSIFVHQLQTLTLVMTVFLVTVVLSFSLGINRGLELWKQSQGQSIQDFVRTELENIHYFADLKDGESVEEFLAPFLDPSLYLFVFNDQQELIFWYWKGDSWYLEDGRPDQERAAQALRELAGRIDDTGLFPRIDPDAPNNDPGLFARLQEQGAISTVEVDGSGVAYFSAGSNGFTITRENKILVENLIIALAVGLIAAIGTGVVISLIRTRKISEHARAVAHSLENLASRSEPPRFSETSLQEFNRIVRSACVLDERLTEETRLRRQWALDIAHDLRTPIAGLRAQLEGLEDGVVQPGPDRYRSLLAELSRMEDLTNGFLLLTKVESPDFHLQIERYATTDLAESLREMFSARFETARRTLLVESVPGTVSCDRSLFLRAVGNTVENALRHGTGTVTVSVASERLRVSNGGTIPESILPTIFDRLVRGDGDRGATGHGLGLAISQAILERHGWVIEARNQGRSVVITMEKRNGQ